MIKKETVPNEELIRLERSLRKTLLPVKPDQNFIGSLRKKLEEEASEDHSHRIAISFLTIAAGLVAGLMIVLIGQILIREKE